MKHFFVYFYNPLKIELSSTQIPWREKNLGFVPVEKYQEITNITQKVGHIVQHIDRIKRETNIDSGVGLSLLPSNCHNCFASLFKFLSQD